MADSSLICILRTVPTEAILLLSPEGELVETSEAARKLMDEFETGVILEYGVRAIGVNGPQEYRLRKIENVSSRQKFLDREHVILRFTAHQLPLDFKIVVYIQRLPLYESLLDKSEMMEFLIENLPIGVALHKIDPDTGKTSHPILNRKMAEICGAEAEDMQNEGSYVVTDTMQEEERAYVESCVTGAYKDLSNVTFTVNTLRKTGEYAPTKFTLQCYPDDNGQLQGVALGEEGIESDVEPVSVRRSARLMLSSFLSAVFDVSFYVNSKFQFIDESSRVRYFFSTDLACTLLGKPLEVFMTLDEDKHRFREYMVRSLEQLVDNLCVSEEHARSDPLFNTPTRLVHSVAPMIRLRLATAENPLSECEVFVTPTYSNGHHQADSTSYSSIGSSSEASIGDAREPVYLVGVRSLKSSNTNTPPNFVANGVSQQAKPGMRPSPNLSLIPEESGYDPRLGHDSSSTSESPRTAVSVYGNGGPSDSVVYGRLARYISYTMNELLSSNVQFHPDIIHEKDEWLIPVYDERNDWAASEQDLLLWLPHNLQSEFVAASRQLNYLDCSHILTFSTEGNLGILHKTKGSRLVKNSAMIQQVFRFFCAMVQELSDTSARQLLALLQKQLASISKRRLSATEQGLMQLHVSLSLIATASRYPNSYTSDPADMDWLRKSFISSLTLQAQCPPKAKAVMLPIVYFLSFLWGGLMKDIGRVDEALNLLGNIFDDIQQFCVRHPFNTCARQIQASICYNIIVTSLHRGHLKMAFHWLANLQSVMEVPYIEFPTQCEEVLEWAKLAQDRAEMA